MKELNNDLNSIVANLLTPVEIELVSGGSGQGYSQTSGGYDQCGGGSHSQGVGDYKQRPVCEPPDPSL